MRVRDAILEAELRLDAAGITASRLEAEVLVAHVARRDRSWVLAHPEGHVDDEVFEVISRRARHEPLAYITGWREFYGRRFAVTPEVLIPRHETETLIDVALAQHNITRVLDVGTGSGCIAVTLAAERSEWEVTATDLSSQALEVASQNARAILQVERSVRFVQSDLLRSLNGEAYDLIVSNPPYVATSDVLPDEVKNFEPHQALFAGEDGLDVYRRLAAEAGEHLKPGGRLILEVGDDQADAVVQLFAESGWTCASRHKDLGGVERALMFTSQNTALP